jgi:hypothetical protein
MGHGTRGFFLCQHLATSVYLPAEDVGHPSSYHSNITMRRNAMNALRGWFAGKTSTVPEESVAAKPDWRTYRAGEGDRAGRKI